MDLQSVLFWSIASFTGLCALAVVLAQNIVRAATWLLFTLAGTSGIFFLLGADFVAATQLLVYVGGTLVLVVFGVMLTAQGPFISMKTGAAEWAVAMVVGLLLFSILAVSILTPGVLPPSTQTASDAPKPADSMNSVVLGQSLLGVEKATPDGYLIGARAVEKKVRTRVSYLLPFEIVSVHLLVVLIGAAYLARAKRRRGATA
jgi:NADH-quinone oxidoreductase subunit J